MTYIDPGSGTLLWQALLSGALGALYVFRSSLSGMLGAVRSRFQRPGPRSSEVDGR